MTGNGGGPMPLAEPAVRWSHAAGRPQRREAGLRVGEDTAEPRAPVPTERGRGSRTPCRGSDVHPEDLTGAPGRAVLLIHDDRPGDDLAGAPSRPAARGEESSEVRAAGWTASARSSRPPDRRAHDRGRGDPGPDLHRRHEVIDRPTHGALP